MAGDDHAGVGGEPDRFRFGDQIAYGEDQALRADHHAVADAFGAQDAGGKRIFGYFGAQQDDRVQHRCEVEIEFLRARLQRFVERPWFRV